MSIISLNTIGLDGNIIIKKGGGGGGVRINNQDKVVDITENGTTEVVADGGYTGLGKVTINTEVSGGGVTPSKPKWTGHADAEGLKAIGWTDEDIAYYQATGVNWNEEDDEYHKVTDDNKALYGVLTISNISTYRDRIVYLPKIDTNDVTNMDYKFYGCHSLTAIPMLDTSNVTSMKFTFNDCYSLTTIPQLDTNKVTTMAGIFINCYSLSSIPVLDTSNVTIMSFKNCYSLKAIPMLDVSNMTSIDEMFFNCHSITTIPILGTSNVTSMEFTFYNCYSLIHVNIKKIASTCQLNYSTLLNKDSLLYLINNEAAESAITIKLADYAYDKWATDADIVAALANHPNISISK